MFRRILLVILLLSFPFSLKAQGTAPTPLPGYSVSTFVGYSSLQNAQSSNGMFVSLAVPLKTWDKTWSFNVAGRADNFLLSSPSVNVVTLGPEFRFQFSKPNFMNGQVFQPFGNIGGGMARSSCVAAMTCAAGADTTTHGALKLGGGLDMVVSSNITWRLLEYDYIKSTIFPAGHVTVHNLGQFTTAIGFHF